MAFMNDNYAEILRTNRIHYLPSCLIVEMMTRLHGRIVNVPLDEAHQTIAELTTLLRRLTDNLRATADAYDQNRIHFFIGDWKDDKIRVRKLFFNLMSRLGRLGEMADAATKRQIYDCTEEMVARWNELDRIMEQKCRQRSTCAAGDCDTCSYFRSIHPGCWQRIMASILMSLYEARIHDDPETKLILLCYGRIRSQVIRVIQEREKQDPPVHRFPVDTILVCSTEDTGISCPKCALMVDSIKKEGSDLPHRRRPAPAVHHQPTNRRKRPSSPTRYLMPTSLNFSEPLATLQAKHNSDRT